MLCVHSGPWTLVGCTSCWPSKVVNLSANLCLNAAYCHVLFYLFDVMIANFLTSLYFLLHELHSRGLTGSGLSSSLKFLNIGDFSGYWNIRLMSIFSKPGWISFKLKREVVWLNWKQLWISVVAKIWPNMWSLGWVTFFLHVLYHFFCICICFLLPPAVSLDNQFTGASNDALILFSRGSLCIPDL